MRTALALLALLVSAPALAQSPGHEGRWGIAGNFIPEQQWSPDLFRLFLDSVREINVKGPEFTVGVVRGSQLGGEWGISFTRKSYNHDAVAVRTGSGVCNEERCLEDTDTFQLRAASLYGLEAHKFVPFGTIARRVQLGMTFAGGILAEGGSVSVARVRNVPGSPVCAPSGASCPVVANEETVTQTFKDAMNELSAPSILPSIKIGATVAVIATPQMKVKLGAGFNFPGYHVVEVGVTYLLGNN
jgi:hypothetical protein